MKKLRGPRKRLLPDPGSGIVPELLSWIWLGTIPELLCRPLHDIGRGSPTEDRQTEVTPSTPQRSERHLPVRPLFDRGVTLPDSVTEISEGTFEGCESLEPSAH